MSQTIKLKRSSVAGRVPTTLDLELGEVAINTYDGKMYLKQNQGGTESVVEVTGGGSSSSSPTVYTVSGTSVNISPNNGQIQTWDLTADSSWDFGTWGNGESVRLLVNPGSNSLQNPGVFGPPSNPFGSDFASITSSYNIPSSYGGKTVFIIIFEDFWGVPQIVSTGWTQLGENIQGQRLDGAVYYKQIEEGGETVQFQRSGYTFIGLVIERDPNVLQPFTYEVDNGFGIPNPPSLEMTAGNYSLIFGVLYGDDYNLTPPTGYTLINKIGYPGDNTLTVAYKEILTTGLEDPGSFSASSSEQWVAGIMEVPARVFSETIKWKNGRAPNLTSEEFTELKITKIGTNYYGEHINYS